MYSDVSIVEEKEITYLVYNILISNDRITTDILGILVIWKTPHRNLSLCFDEMMKLFLSPTWTLGNLSTYFRPHVCAGFTEFRATCRPRNSRGLHVQCFYKPGDFWTSFLHGRRWANSQIVGILVAHLLALSKWR